MRWHILFVISGGDRRLYRYVLGWLAFAVQHPGRRAEVALVLHGGRGTGKGFLVRAIGGLFGPHFMHVFHAKRLTGNFNAHLADALIVFADEAFWAGDKAGEGALKGLITEPEIAVEPKFFNVEMVPNRLKIIMASNNDWVIPAGMDERRFCVLDVSDIRKQDSTYFGSLQQEIDNGGLQAMLYDLLHRDLRKFDIRKVPNTEALKAQKILSLRPAQRWWLDKLTAGEWLEHLSASSNVTVPHPWTRVPKEVVHDDYVRSLQKVGEQRKSSQTELGMALTKLLPSGWPQVSKPTTARGPAGTPARPPTYTFPPLSDCRAHFEKLAGLTGRAWP